MKLTQEELAALIARVFANLVAQGKTDNIATEDIMTELTAVLESDGGENSDKNTDENADENVNKDGSASENEGKDETESAAVPSEFVAQVLEVLKSVGESNAQKSANSSTQQKSAQPVRQNVALQRKYADIFMTAPPVRGGARQGGDFKTRIASMSDRDRRKATFGAFGRAVKCIHASHGDAEKAADTAEHKFSDTEMAREFKALSATSPSDGGYLVPEIYANEIIELLYPATVIYALDARRLGMEHGNLNLPKIKTGSRAMFTGEARAIPKTAPKFGNLKLSAKKLTALIPMSNDLLRSTSFDNDVIVGQDVTKQMALGIDWGALLGAGGEFQPLGVLRNKGVLNIDATSLDAAYASASGVLTAMFPNYLAASVLKSNVYANGLGFVFNTSVEQFFKSLRDNVGGFIFAEEMSKGSLVGYPYRTTNLLETVNGKTSIIFGNWNDLVIGEQGALEIETSREGSWTDDAGNVVSAFENDQTLIRAINHVDAGLRHEESFAVATKVAVPV